MGCGLPQFFPSVMSSVGRMGTRTTRAERDVKRNADNADNTRIVADLPSVMPSRKGFVEQRDSHPIYGRGHHARKIRDNPRPVRVIRVPFKSTVEAITLGGGPNVTIFCNYLA